MKRCPKIVAVLMLLVFAAASGSAMARGGHGGGGRGGSGHGGGGHSAGSDHGGRAAHGGGHGHSRGVGVGIAVGIPLFGLAYFPYPDHAYPEPDYSYPGTTGYVEQGVPEAAQTPDQPEDWYFCADSNAYYPYVKECPSGWQRGPAQPQR